MEQNYVTVTLCRAYKESRVKESNVDVGIFIRSS